MEKAGSNPLHKNIKVSLNVHMHEIRYTFVKNVSEYSTVYDDISMPITKFARNQLLNSLTRIINS